MPTKKRRGERPDGLIQVSCVTGRKPDGSYIRKSFYGHTRAEAEQKRDKFLGKGKDGATVPDVFLRDWIETYKATYRTNINPAYIKIDDVPYNRLRDKLGHMRISDIRETDLQRTLNEMAGMSFSSVEKYLQAVKRVFSKARKNKLIPDDPSEDLRLPTYTKGTHRALDKWEVALIMDNWQKARCGLWAMVMLLSGLRRGELMALQWDAIDMTNRTLTVQAVAVVHGNQTTIEQRAKTEAGLRTIPICQKLFDALSTIPPEKRNGFLCISAKGKQCSQTTFARGFENFCAAMERIANGENPCQLGARNDLHPSDLTNRIKFSIRAHDLRHTFATALYDAGVPVKVAQYYLGHADIKITLDLYTHISKERESDSRQQMIQYLDNWLENKRTEPNSN